MITIGTDLPERAFDDNIFQGKEPTCAIRSQEIIMRDFGIQIPQEELKQYAIQQGWFDDGTPENYVGNLLETCGVSTHSAHCDSVYDLINELKEGHRVIVAVDSQELWAEEGSPEHEFWKHVTQPDHALIVTSLNIDIEDPSQSYVMLTDPGSGAIMKRSMEHFAHAWGDSKCFMVATDEAAPYQYNPELQCMEVSNFATDYSIQEFPFHNEFTDIWEVGQLGYVPFYGESHVNFITDEVTYDDFVTHFNDDDLEWLSSSIECDENSVVFGDDDGRSFTDFFVDTDWISSWGDFGYSDDYGFGLGTDTNADSNLNIDIDG